MLQDETRTDEHHHITISGTPGVRSASECFFWSKQGGRVLIRTEWNLVGALRSLLTTRQIASI